MPWTASARHQYARTATRYTTDLTDTEFALIAPPPAYSSLRHRFRNGPLGVKPLEQVSRRWVHASVRGRHDGRHTMPSGEEPTSQSLAAWFRPRGVGPPAVSRLRRFPRPGDGTSREQDGSVPLRSCLLRSRRLRLGSLPPEAELAAVHPQAV